MKKISLILLVLFANMVIGQEKGTSDININAGVLTSNDILTLTSDFVLASISGGNIVYDTKKVYPAMGLDYKYAIKKNLFVLVSGSYQKIEEDILVNKQKEGTISRNFISTGLGLEYHYLNSNWFQLYSGVIAGYTFERSNVEYRNNPKENKKNNYFNFHIDAIGIRIGNKLALTGALGLGYKGIFNLGVSYQF